MTPNFTIECSVHFHGRGRGRRQRPPRDSVTEPGRVPRVAKLLALSLRMDQLVRTGEVTSFAELAALGHVTRARMSQIMCLLCLAPDIQEEILFLPRTLQGRDPIQLRQLLPIAVVPDWRKQRVRWKELIH